ncbi:hypothetical protein SEVIR_7G064000v4 [Setaria viridis]|uniref:Protein kinase domain-containing protein n=2 Tax=Setaria TaxID=4554 RepID=A0A368RSG0_SETIT|nr:probable serine/threonine-protein kinase PBL16 isoform X2 [Setaria viridis]RCV33120.1 hypothetical protein SETIT_7G057200v2 [Setaria italica]RCV33121.1 hypothetical protein SETIT_7G057200v2 [Setaria italica]RCV33122.1 hypothetical protein SETIT_7G057200v2 [Setaria italica]RCV33123.1 hypothetical protein SETIT_7G057200v2 [Setaria italica]RCV33124.1 hypothetical protein SETIT_7G057200v2 [Setaria italica]
MGRPRHRQRGVGRTKSGFLPMPPNQGGGFGRVYKGYITKDLREGLEIEEPLRVAVKVHDGDNSLQGHREWLSEVIFPGQLSHPNLVKLIGYCCEDDHRVLVYEFMPLGSVESHLFSKWNAD